MERNKDGVPLDPPKLTAAEMAELRRMRERAEAVYRMPTEPYLGLTRDEAERLAQQEGRVLRLLGPTLARKMDRQSNRVNIVLDASGRVRRAWAG